MIIDNPSYLIRIILSIILQISRMCAVMMMMMMTMQISAWCWLQCVPMTPGFTSASSTTRLPWTPSSWQPPICTWPAPRHMAVTSSMTSNIERADVTEEVGSRLLICHTYSMQYLIVAMLCVYSPGKVEINTCNADLILLWRAYWYFVTGPPTHSVV